MTLLVSCDTDTRILDITWLRMCVFLMQWIEWCYWQCHWHQMITKSCYISFWSSWTNKCRGTIDDAISVMIWQHWHHMTKKVMLPCFNHLDQTKIMKSLGVPSVLCDAHTDANSTTWPKESCQMLFQLTSHDEKMALFMMQLASHDNNTGTNCTIWLKKSYFTSFWSLWPNECNGAIENNTYITKICLYIV